MKMTYPRVKFRSGIEVDTTAYIENLEDVKLGFFKDKLYLILPYLSKQKDIAGKTIYFPRLHNSISPSLSTSYNEILDGLKSRKINISKYEEYFNSNFKKFWSDLSSIFPGESLNKIEEIVVEITNVGSGGRCFTESYGKGILCIRLRSDMPVAQLFSLIIMGVLKNNGYKSDFTWDEKTAIKDWLMESTILNRYFPKKFSMLSGLRKNSQQAKYFVDSQSYLKEIGVDTEIEVIDSKVNLNGNPLSLSDKENRLLSVLVSNRGNIVSYDDIYMAVWGDDSDSFSLYSITKLVERLRNKLEKEKVSNLIIQAYKGKGYYLK